jgi:2-isopropylmalate synthase
MTELSNKIEILDTTLRDGAQSENISFSTADKRSIIKTLSEFGITFIEAGNPGSNPKDAEVFKAPGAYLSSLTAFGSTRKKDTNCENDTLFMSLIGCAAESVSIFGKASAFHVKEILGATPEENLSMISDSIDFAVKKGKNVLFDAEHFFDGYKADSDYAKLVIKTAAEAGASRIILCDTNGGSLPEEIADICKDIKAMPEMECIVLGIHCHNDCVLADANTLAAVRACATHIQGTFTGIGERCGNANLSVLIPVLMLKYGIECVTSDKLAELTETARKIAEIMNMRLPDGMPFVGKSAFAHKAGMHADGVLKNSATFEHIDPATVGNDRNILLSEVAGRANVIAKVKKIIENTSLAGRYDKNSPEISDLIKEIKERELMGYQYEGADASFEILVRERFGIMPEYFTLDYYKILGEKTGDAEPLTSAIIKARVGDKTKLRVHEGDGPVNAIDKALRKALSQFYPVLESVHLTDYKVRIMDGKKATAADVRVLIESSDGVKTWTTVGASTNIINASVAALIDSIKYKLLSEDKN